MALQILEVWTGTVEEQHAALVGIVKVSLARFGAFLRYVGSVGIDEVVQF